MSIQHALLTSLLEKPSSDYELANRFDHSIGYFWHATHQQIYLELAEHDATDLVHYLVDGKGRRWLVGMLRVVFGQLVGNACNHCSKTSMGRAFRDGKEPTTPAFRAA